MCLGIQACASTRMYGTACCKLDIQSISVQGQEAWEMTPFPMSVGQGTQYTLFTSFLLISDFVTAYNRKLVLCPTVFRQVLR